MAEQKEDQQQVLPAPADEILFQPGRIGAFSVRNRVVMAPMTRLRNQAAGDVPNEDAVAYYSQRASAGLIVTEASNISFQGKGYHGSPGCHNAQQVAAWKKVTEAVHARGGAIVIQLWHTGRVSHHSVQPYGMTPVAPSAVDHPDVRTSIKGDEEQLGPNAVVRVKSPMPQELSPEGIRHVLNDWATATRCAKEAGFDGIEIHCAHGYLIHQFLATSSNQRKDKYGGSMQNRARFALEAIDAAIGAWSADRIGVRLSPVGSYHGAKVEPVDGDNYQQESDLDCALYLIRELGRRNIAYIHFSEMEWAGNSGLPTAFRKEIREVFPGSIICAGGYTSDSAASRLRQGTADAIAFGRKFVANPDLVERMRLGAEIAEADPMLFYGGDKRGYLDYPTLEEQYQDQDGAVQPVANVHDE